MNTILAWPVTHDEVYPADSPPGHLRNALTSLQLHREVEGIPEDLRPVWENAERRLRLAIAGLERLEAGGFVQEAPR